MIQWVLKQLTAPVLGSLVDGYKAKLAAGNDKDRIAADLAGRELELQKKEIEVQAQLRIAQLGYWYEPDKLMGYGVAIYVIKLLVWDKVLGLGATDPLVGWVENTANLIVAFYFGKRGVENAIKIWRGGK